MNTRQARAGAHMRRAIAASSALTLTIAASGSLAEPPIAHELDAAWTTVTKTHLPPIVLGGKSMDAVAADLDLDGDLDLVVATEFAANKLLLNDGHGKFTDASSLLANRFLDTEDIAVADFNNDGRPDIFFVSEDTQDNELYLAVENGYEDHSSSVPVAGTSNAIAAADIDNDGDIDVVIGNNGQNTVLLNDGNATFTDVTESHFPKDQSVTQDIELADIDGDGDLDLAAANEDRNRLYLNDGTGVFTDASGARLPVRPGGAPEMSRDVDFADVDNDGDMDLYFANVPWVQGADPRDRLLINDGAGRFADESEQRLPGHASTATDADFVDIDNDGDLDILATRFLPGAVAVLINNGDARFTDQTALWMPPGHPGQGVDLEAADFNNDGKLDLFVCHFQTGPDQLLLATNN